jgi:tripeptidyl-peptidase-1
MLSLAFAALAYTPTPVVVERKMYHLRDDYRIVASAQGAETHELTFAIKQKNLDKLEAKLYAVSTPGSEEFRKYLSYEEAHALTANPDAARVVSGWLMEHSVTVTSMHSHGHYVRASANVSTWERLLTTSFSHLINREGSGQVLRATADVHVPSHLSTLVTGILRATSLPPRRRQAHKLEQLTLSDEAKTSKVAQGSITPAVLKSYYNVGSAEGSTSSSQCVFESLGQYYSPDDLSTFEQDFGIPTEKVTTDTGGHASSSQCSFNPNNCAEANLDVQYMIAMSEVSPETFWYESNQQTPFESWIEAVAADTTPPLVNSISYGSIESEVASSVTSTFNTEAMRLGAQGVSVFVSSGDDGVANFIARSDAAKCGYNPSFPASSPYVTAVGATQGVESGSAEIACSEATGGAITTGGGFSTKYDAPKYQTSAIADYFAAVSPTPASGYKVGGRGYPDVAMSGYNYAVVIAGNTYAVSGTSASSPVVAGMASLVNAKRATSNQPPIGFINPVLYAAGVSAFNDITSGNNKCTASSVCCSEGFYSTPGWDPVTGLGSVDYAKFEALF